MDNAKKYSVLIVDDEAQNIMELTHILQSDYTIYVAKTGAAAIKAAKKHLPDLILLDVIMPEMSGYAVIAELKEFEQTKNIPIIFITRLSDSGDAERGLALGAVDYITKPFPHTLVKLRVANQIALIEQLRQNEYDIMKYKLSNDALNIALWDMDVVSGDPINPGNRFTWSREFREMLGFSDEDDFPNVLQSWSDQLHPEDKKETLSAFMAHMNDYSGRTPYDVEYRLKLKNGEYRHFHALGTTFRDNAGIPVRVAGALMDITEKKRMEREIADSIAKIESDAHWYKSILDAISLPITVTDADMKWTFVNKAVEDFLGVKREDIYGTPCSNWDSEICNTDNCGIACAKRGLKHTYFSRKDSYYQVDVEILRDMEDKIAGFIEVVQDITDIQELARQRAEIEMTSHAKSAFLANMSHEIRTPMNAIWGITEILMQDGTLPVETMEGLGRIHSSCGLLIGIINDILDFSKIEAGKMDIMPAQYNVASLLNDSIHLNMMRIGDKPIEFDIQIDENILSKLIGDELRIKQILNNLLSNAFKYTDTGKVTLSAAFEPSKHGVTLILSVRDTGRGMTAEQVERLFEEYSRFNQEGGPSIEGTGLGLSITQRLVALMGGEIYVDSEPGKGSVFTVRLPQGTVDADVLGGELADELRQFRLRYMTSGQRTKIIREPMPYGNVLIVDDVETNLYVSQGLMKPYGLKIDTAMSGPEAIDKIKSGNVYDIVFMDHMMPVMDGIETTRLLRGLGYASPIVALTANAVIGQSDIFLQNGFDAFISKPIDIRHLNSILNKLIRDKQPPEVIEAARRSMPEVNACGGQQQVNSLLLGSFIRDANKAMAVLEELRQKAGFESEEALRAFTITVHGIKSALANIGESALSESAYRLEQAGRERNIDLITACAPEFHKQLRSLLEKLQPGSAADGADEDIGGLLERLLRIQEMCADYNRKGALDILQEIEQENCSKETREVLGGITELILHSEFDEAEKAVGDYASGMCSGHRAGAARMREIAGIDIEKGLERYGGDMETYLKILRSYTVCIRSMLGQIETVGEDTLADYKVIVHGIKGASRDIFAEQVGASAAELEQAAKAGDLGYITGHNPPFLEAAWKLIGDLESVLSASAGENQKPKKDKPDAETLSKLLAACEKYDMDGADAAMEEIGRCQYEADGGLADWLRDNVSLMNFTQIIERLSALDK